MYVCLYIYKAGSAAVPRADAPITPPASHSAPQHSAAGQVLSEAGSFWVLSHIIHSHHNMYVYAYIYTYIYIYTHAYLYLYLSIFLYLYLSIFLYIYLSFDI